MTTEQLLTRLRRKLNDIDPATQSFVDAQLLQAIADVLDTLSARNVSGFSGYAVDLVAATLTPAPSVPDGELLSHLAAVDLLEQTYRGRVNRGEMGTVWRSGLESESSVDAARAYRALIRELDTEAKELLLVRVRATFATRPQ